MQYPGSTVDARGSLRNLLGEAALAPATYMPHLDRIRDDELRAAQDAVQRSLSSLRTGLALLVRRHQEDHEDGLALEKDLMALAMRVADILELARIRLDEDDAHHQPLMLDQVVGSVLDDGRAALAPHGIVVDAHLQHDIAVTTDARRLRELTLRFLDLGVRGVGPDGRVALRVQAEGGRATLEVESPALGGAAQDSVGLRVCRTLATTLGARLIWAAPQRLQLSLPLRLRRRAMPTGVADLRFL